MSFQRMRSRAAARRLGTYLGERLGRVECFVQDDQTVANAAGATVRADINSNLQALVTNSQGTSAPSTTWRNQWWHDTTNNVIKRRNAANSAWIVEATLDESFVIGRSSNTILGLSDIGKTFVYSGTFSQTFTAAATLGDRWCIGFRVESGNTVTFDPNSSENINGATTLAVTGPASGFIVCNGSAFYTVGYSALAGSGLASASGSTITVTGASQAQQETASSTAVAVTPGVQQYHPSAAKAWAQLSTSGGTPTKNVSYNVSSITDNGVGDFTFNFTTAFSSANYAFAGSCGRGNAGGVAMAMEMPYNADPTTSAIRGLCVNDTYSAVDPKYAAAVFFGDQ